MFRCDNVNYVYDYKIVRMIFNKPRAIYDNKLRYHDCFGNKWELVNTC